LAKSYVEQTGVCTTFSLQLPLAQGGSIANNLDLLDNIFLLPVQQKNIIDLFQRTLGIYENHSKKAFWNTFFNPFWWLWKTASLPILFFRWLFGFSVEKKENGFWGKLCQLVGFLAELSVLVSFFGYGNRIVQCIKYLFNAIG